MISVAQRITSIFNRGETPRLISLYSAIALLHIVGFGLLLSVAPRYPVLLGLGSVAYTFGLRHAFDADHISAIDNVTRKLLQGGKRPVGVGFFFSMGHSAVVFLLSIALGLATRTIVDRVFSDSSQLRNIGGLVATGVAGTFLLLIGILNLIILLDILMVFRRMKRGKYDRASLELDLVSGGVLTRLFGRLFTVVSHSWEMFPIGFLFGLGFETASEVLLLAVSAGAVSQGLPIVAVLSLPVVFAAGMSLMDTTDGVFMVKAYSWAFSSPIRKLFYNLTMTSLSVFVALFVGTVEIAQNLSQALDLKGGLWDEIDGLDLASLGFVIVGAFVLAWIGAFFLFKLQRVEERWSTMLDS